MQNGFDNTKEWNEYRTGVDYNSKVNYYNKVDLNWKFYNGNQWVGIVTNGLSKWTFNMVRSAINYFIAFIMSQKVKMQYSAENLPDDPTDTNDIKTKQFVELMSKAAEMKWEKDKMDSKLRELLLDGANSADYAVHVLWDDAKKTGQLEVGDFETEIIDGVNLILGNPNNRIIEKQPYILIIGRDMVSNLKEEARHPKNNVDEMLIKSITPDQENTYQAGEYGKIESDAKDDNGKCLYIIKYWKEKGTVYWNKSTKSCPIVKKRDLDIKRYPVAFGNWESVKNSYHGMSAAEGMIDNQISINQLFAMVSYWMKMSAFGKTIIDGTMIDSWTNKIGDVIKTNGSNGGRISDMVYQMQAGNFNAAILTVIDMAIKYTKEFIGANDALMGQVNPEQASGTAIISTAKQAAIPLSNIQANRDQFIEDIGLIWGEFFLRKYKNRKVSYRDKGKINVSDYSSEGMEDILLSCKVDVGPSTYWSEITSMQTLDNLLNGQKIDMLQYLERIPDGVIPKKQELIDQLKAQIEQQQQMQAQQVQMQQEQAMAQQGMQQQQEQSQQAEQQAQMEQEQQSKNSQWEQMAKFMESLPPEVQDKLQTLPPDMMEKELLGMMQGDVRNSMKTA